MGTRASKIMKNREAKISTRTSDNFQSGCHAQ
jgi:hypothetical protein